jgi:hypothetical protein
MTLTLRVRWNRRRLTGSAAALGFLVGAPSAPFLVENAGHYWASGTAATLAVVALGLLAGRLLWPDEGLTRVAAILAAAGICSFVAAVAGLFAVYAVTISSGLCGKDGSSNTPTSAGLAALAAYVLIGLWGFQRPRRLVWAWPVAVGVAAGLALGITAALPSMHGYCET